MFPTAEAPAQRASRRSLSPVLHGQGFSHVDRSAAEADVERCPRYLTVARGCENLQVEADRRS